jgi:hypothetical protein
MYPGLRRKLKLIGHLSNLPQNRKRSIKMRG